MPTVPRWIIDTANPTAGLYVVNSGGLEQVEGVFIRNDELPREIQLLVNTPTTTRQPLDITGGTLKVTVSDADLSALPIAGTWSIEYNGEVAGSEGMAFDISAADLQAALNANTGMVADNATVTVTKQGNSFIITFDDIGARYGLQVFPDGLVPFTTGEVIRARVGTIGSREIQIITLTRDAYVEETEWATDGGSAGSITQIAAGSVTQPAVFELALSETAIGGTASLAFGGQHIYDIKAVANTATKASGTITLQDASVSMLADTYFDLPGNSTTIRFWSDVGGVGTAPAVPPGGSLSAISSIAGTETDLALAALVSAAIDAHAEFTATVSGNVVTWVAVNYGPKAIAASTGSANAGMGGAVAGNFGALHLAAFVIYDETGSVAGWFDAAAVGAAGYPAAAAEADRQIRFVIAPGDTAVIVAGVIQAAITGDSKFTSTNPSSGNLVRATVDAIGLRTDPVGLEPSVEGFTVETNQVGSVTHAEIPYKASVGDITIATNGAFAVTALGPSKWRLTAVATGTLAIPTLSEAGLTQPTYFIGSLHFDETALKVAVACAGANELAARLEVEYTDTDENTSTVLSVPVTVIRDAPPSGAGEPGFPATVAGKYRFKTDGSFQLWNPTQSLWHTLTLTGLTAAEELVISAGES